MIKRFIIVVAILLTVQMAAQEGTSSPYSYYGIGLTKFKGTVENQSMGGLMVFSDSIHVNLRNPAGYGKLKITTYTLGASHQRNQLSTATEKENSSTTSLDYLAIGICVDRVGRADYFFGDIGGQSYLRGIYDQQTPCDGLVVERPGLCFLDFRSIFGRTCV